MANIFTNLAQRKHKQFVQIDILTLTTLCAIMMSQFKRQHFVGGLHNK